MGDQLILGVVPERVLAVFADDVQGWEDINGVIDSALDVFELYVLIWILLQNVAKIECLDDIQNKIVVSFRKLSPVPKWPYLHHRTSGRVVGFRW